MRLREFYDRVTEGMALRELWGQFRADAESSYRLYSEDVDWKSLEQLPAWKRLLKVCAAFFWAMLMHLSPARRILLLLSLTFFTFGLLDVQNRPSLMFYGSLGLLVVLALELADRVIMKRDLQIAREIQRWLVPETPPRVEGLDVAFATRPANTVGGDFYDVILSQDAEQGEKLLLVMADVAGKSVPAALLMATFQASLKSLTATDPSLQTLARGLNRGACDRSQGGRRFTTAFLGEIDLANRQMRYINAGHNYPFLRRAGGKLERLPSLGPPFGILADQEYPIEQTQLAKGDLMLVFTDGVVEAVNSKGDEFGDPTLASLIAGLPGAGAEECLKSLRSAVDDFVGPTRQHDDMTWMLVRVN